jgi:hypothetical protein
MVILVASSLLLWISGISVNGGAPGYGASKYLVTATVVSVPLLWMALVHYSNGKFYLKALSPGLVLIFAIVSFQYDSRPVASALTSAPQPINLEPSESGVFVALEEAMQKFPEQIFCVSDYGLPLIGGEVNMNSYLCTRWGQSLAGDENGQEWRFVPLGRSEEATLLPVLEAYRDKKVVLIRFTDPETPMPLSETWWYKYTDKSWQVITVR